RQFPLGYWAPEVFREENEDEKSLVYTLGAFLVHLISGRWPFHHIITPNYCGMSDRVVSFSILLPILLLFSLPSSLTAADSIRRRDPPSEVP
ncbi:hypothetical protein PENTCL1PPCAC_30780, partial [Pristionchus entomophagus]